MHLFIEIVPAVLIFKFILVCWQITCVHNQPQDKFTPHLQVLSECAFVSISSFYFQVKTFETSFLAIFSEFSKVDRQELHK